MLLLMTALALSLDGFTAGCAFGMRGVRFERAAKLTVALLSCLLAAVSIALGGLLGGLLPAGGGRYIGGAVLVLLGLWSLGKAAAPQKDTPPAPPKPPKSRRFHLLGVTILVIREPAEGDLDCSGVIDPKEAFLLGLSLSVDMLGAGTGIAMGGGQSLLLPLLAGAMQTLCLTAGEAAGRHARRLPLPSWVFGALCGALLTGLGLWRLLGQ